MRGEIGSSGRWGTRRPIGGRRAPLLVFMLTAAILGVYGIAVGCGTGPPDVGSADPGLTATSVGHARNELSSREPSTLAVADFGSSSSTARRLTGIFADLARSMAPLHIYGLVEVERETIVPADWWPVLYLQGPAEYEGPLVANPRVSACQDGAAEVQLVLQHGNGWLVILENFRGDLGEVTGAQVGEVAGHSADLYEVNGGTLVQWSDCGSWYGVFGRGVPATEVVQLALSARLVDPGD